MEIIDKYEVETSRKASGHIDYIEWLENMIGKMKCCENCKFSKFSHGLYNECRKTAECLPNYKEWELL